MQINAKNKGRGHECVLRGPAGRGSRLKGDLWLERCQGNYKNPIWVRDFYHNKD